MLLQEASPFVHSFIQHVLQASGRGLIPTQDSPGCHAVPADSAEVRQWLRHAGPTLSGLKEPPCSQGSHHTAPRPPTPRSHEPLLSQDRY